VGLVIKGYDRIRAKSTDDSTETAKPKRDFGKAFMNNIKTWFETDVA
jgi:hypothetical protein